MSADLAAFLLARIAEDVAVANDAASRPGAAEWPDLRVYDDGARDPAVVASPARVLAECEARRRIVDLHRLGGSYTPGSVGDEGFDYCATCGSGEPYEYPSEWPCETLRLLALPFTDHPDYDPSWRP